MPCPCRMLLNRLFFFALCCLFAVLLSPALLKGQSAQQRQKDSLRTLLQTQAQDTHRVKTLLRLGNLEMKDSSLMYYQMSLKLAETLDFPSGIMNAHTSIGKAYYAQNQHSQALAEHLQVLRMAERLGKKEQIAVAHTNIGNVYQRQLQYEQSIQNYHVALQLRNELRDSANAAGLMNNIGNAFLDRKQFDSALLYFVPAAQIVRHLNNKRILSIVVNNIGMAWEGKKNVANALEYYQQALAIQDEIGNTYGKANTLMNIGTALGKAKKYAQAEASLKAGISLADSIGAREWEEDGYKSLWELYKAQGFIAKALTAHERYSALKDSIFTAEQTESINEMQARYESEKKAQQIKLLEQGRLLQEREISEQTFQRNSLIVGMILVLALLGFAVNRYSIKRRSEQRLREQQRILEDQAIEIHEANIELHQQNEQLFALNMEKNEFMGIAAHDLKNPLASIILSVEKMQRYSSRMTEEQIVQSQNAIIQTTQRMGNIITNLLDMNQLESGGLQLTMVSFDISPVVEAVVDQYRAPAEAKHITLHFSQEAPENIVSADEHALMQVLDNLVSNAVKYSPHGKQAFVRILRNGDAVRIEIQDEGEGISEEDMTKLFGKFARLSARPTGGEHSTGLGLSIVKRMVEAMNGKVWCESELGKGSTFIVELTNTSHQVS